jgi:phage-related minor tail protein
MTEIIVPTVPVLAASGDLWGARKPVPERFSDRSDELADAVADISRSLRSRLEEQLRDDDTGTLAVSEVQLSFALELKAESGVVLAKASVGGTFTATVTWARRPSGSGGSRGSE